jgi:hypothetical protein
MDGRRRTELYGNVQRQPAASDRPASRMAMADARLMP